MVDEIDLIKPEFRVKMNELNFVTILKHIREEYDIEPGDEIILEFKGKINKKETITKPKEVSSKRGK